MRHFAILQPLFFRRWRHHRLAWPSILSCMAPSLRARPDGWRVAAPKPRSPAAVTLCRWPGADPARSSPSVVLLASTLPQARLIISMPVCRTLSRLQDVGPDQAGECGAEQADQRRLPADELRSVRDAAHSACRAICLLLFLDEHEDQNYKSTVPEGYPSLIFRYCTKGN